MKSSGIDIYNDIEFDSWIKNINGALPEKNYCNMIEEHSHEMDNRKSIKKDKYLEHLPFSMKWKLKAGINAYSSARETVVLDINTSEKTRDEAYRFINTFISCISKIGGRVYVNKMENKDNTMVTLLESNYKCSLYEKQVKLRDKLTTEERKMKPLYDLEYNGALCFEVFGEKKDINKNDNWELLHSIDIYNSDIIESKFVDMLYKLRDDAISKKIIIDQEDAKQQEEQEKKIKQWEEDKIREEQANIEKEKLIKKQKMQEKIKTHMDKLEYINKVLIYINDLRSMSGVSDNEKKLIIKYCDYAEKIYSKSEVYKEIIEFSQKLEL